MKFLGHWDQVTGQAHHIGFALGVAVAIDAEDTSLAIVQREYVVGVGPTRLYKLRRQEFPTLKELLYQ